MLVSASEQRMLEEVRCLGRQVIWSEKVRLCMRSIFFTSWLNGHEEGKTRTEEVQARVDPCDKRAEERSWREGKKEVEKKVRLERSGSVSSGEGIFGTGFGCSVSGGVPRLVCESVGVCVCGTWWGAC